MAEKSVNADKLFFRQYIHAELECRHGGKKYRTGEVRKVHFAVRELCEKRSAGFKSGSVLAGIIVVGEQSAAVRRTLKSAVIERIIELRHIDASAHQLNSLFEKTYP